MDDIGAVPDNSASLWQPEAGGDEDGGSGGPGSDKTDQQPPNLEDAELSDELPYESFGELPEETPGNVNGAGSKTIDLSGQIVLMGAAMSNPPEFGISLFVNGERASEFAPIIETIEGAAYPALRYLFAGLPAGDDAQGRPYSYTMQAEGYRNDEVKPYYIADGTIVGDGYAAVPAPADIIFVSLGDVNGVYHVEKEEADPPPEGVLLVAETCESQDAALLTATPEIIMNARDNSWGFSRLPLHNPLTGRKIEYRVRVAKNSPGYAEEYLNASSGGNETEWALEGGTILNRCVEHAELPLETSPAIPVLTATLRNGGLNAAGETPFVIRVIWNDNGAANRPAPTLTVYYKTSDMAGENPPLLLTDAVLVSWGLDPYGGILLPELTDGATNTWTYTYKLPAKLIDKDNPIINPEDPDNQTYPEYAIVYSYEIEDVPGYLVSRSGNTVTVTKETAFAVDKLWKDGGNQYKTRPSETVLLGNLTLYRVVGNGTDVKDLGLLSNSGDMKVAVSKSGDTWSIEVKGLPEYDENGQPYHYYVKETGDSIAVDGGNTLENGSNVTYTASYDNEGNWADNTAECYDKGRIVNRLTETVDYHAEKAWQDDGLAGTISTRPRGTLYLLRYPVTSDLKYGYSTASPVQGKATPLDSSNDGCNIDFSNLPRFDEEGNEYVYFVQEVLTGGGTGNYQRFYGQNGGDTPKARSENALYNGETLYNRRVGTVNPTVTKTWKAAARQSMNASSILLVERKLVSEGDDAFEPVANAAGTDSNGRYALSGFRAEVMELDRVFSGLPQFDDKGLEYEYRINEIGVIIDGNTIMFSGSGSVFTTDDGYEFQVTQTKTAENAWRITNSLVGETRVEIIKIWSGGEPPYPKVSFTLLRDGNPVPISETGVLQIAESDNNRSTLVVSNLARYDGNGKEYKYTVTEAAPGDGYSLTGTSIVREEIAENEKKIGLVKATFTNSKDGEGKYVVARKEWYDDGDEICRGPVTVGLFHTEDNGGTWEQATNGGGTWITAVLNAKNDWEAWILLPDGDYNDYYVTELGVERGSVLYPLDGEAFPALSASPTATGTIKTDAHNYNCYAYASLNGGGERVGYTFRNVRTGTVDIAVEKVWVDDNYHVGRIRSVTLEVLRRGIYNTTSTTSGTITLTLPERSGGITGLPKYDDKGVLFLYDVAETNVEDSDGNVIQVAGGFHLDGHTYAASMKADRQYGEHQPQQTEPQNDQYTFEATNSRSETINFKVYKIWQDVLRTQSAGSGEDTSGEQRVRPDIYLKLYQSAAGGPPVEMPGYVERVWTTAGSDAASGYTFNEYLWQCEFDPLPRYDGSGGEIVYSVKEMLTFQGEYIQEYYDGKPKEVSGADKTALALITSVAPIFDPSGTLTDAAPNGGTIVNRRKGERYLTGQKIWLNVPSGVNPRDLPEIALRLKVYKYVETGGGSYEYVAEGNVEVQLDGVKKNFIFEKGGATLNSLPKYDGYGTFIKYRVQELVGSDETATVPGYLAPVYDDYTLTVVNQYDAGQQGSQVDVRVTKTWDGPDVSTLGLAGTWWQPTVTIELWRVMAQPTSGADVGATPPEKVGSKDIHYDSSGSSVITFEDLPKIGYNGEPFRYFVKEYIDGREITEGGSGYSVVVSNDIDVGDDFEFEIKNTYTGANYITLTGTKTWSDYDNTYASRPAAGEINLHIYRVVDSEKLDITGYVDVAWPTSSENVWSYTVTPHDAIAGVAGAGGGLYRYAPNGKAYVYYVEEALPNAHYTASSVTNSSASGVGSPDHFTLKGNADNNGHVTANFINTLKTTGCTVTKVWMKETNASGPVGIPPDEYEMMLPDSVTYIVEYSRDGGTAWSSFYYNVGGTPTLLKQELLKGVYMPTVDKNGAMAISFYNLPKYDPQQAQSNVALMYRIVETDINGNPITAGSSAGGYALSDNRSASGEITTITNTLETIPIIITKHWKDYENQDGTRPSNGIITFVIAREDGTSFTIEMTEADWLNGTEITAYVPKYRQDGVTLSAYAVEEQFMGRDAYTLSPNGTATNPVVGYSLGDPSPNTAGTKRYPFLNKYEEYKKIDITVQKVWDDGKIDDTIGTGEVDNIRPASPASVTVTLQRSEDNGVTWKNVVNADLLDLPNGDHQYASVTLSRQPDGTWSGHKWEYLTARFNASTSQSTVDMRAYVYRVIEVPIEGYTQLSTTVSDDNGMISLTNTLMTTSLAVKKTWEHQNGIFTDEPPVTVQLLYRLENSTDWNTGEATLILQSSNNFAGIFTGLPQKNNQGTPYEYSVKEISIGAAQVSNANGSDKAAGFIVTGSGTSAVTNTREVVDLTIEKWWEDGLNQDGIRPSSVTFTVTRDGTETKTVTLNDTRDQETISMTVKVPKYKLDGTPSSYTVEEVNAAYPLSRYGTEYKVDAGDFENACAAFHYQSTDSHTVAVRNTYTPKTMDLTVTKVWDDGDDAFGTRPDSVTLRLLSTTNPDGKSGAAAAGVPDIALPTATQTWTDGWTGLPVMSAGKRIYYSVEEVTTCEGYGNPIYGYALKAASTGIVVAGVALAGSIDDALGGAHSAEITNSLSTVNVTVEKVWVDYDNFHNSRPDSLSFALQYRTKGAFGPFVDAGIAKSLPVTSANPLTYVFTKLPKYNPQTTTEREYRVVETAAVTNGSPTVDWTLTPEDLSDPVEGTLENVYQYKFKTETTGLVTTVTNTLVLPAVTVSAEKRWADENDRFGARPDSVTLKLQYAEKNGLPSVWKDYPDPDTSAPYSVELSERGGWSVSVPGLQKYGPDGTTELAYRFVETGALTSGSPNVNWTCTPGMDDAAGTIANGSGAVYEYTSSTLPQINGGETTGYETTVTNSLETTRLEVTKNIDRGPGSMEFEFEVYLSPAPIGGQNPGVLYTGAYQFTTAGGTQTKTGNSVTINAGESFTLLGLPAGYYYRVAELAHPDYALDTPPGDLTGQLRENTVAVVSVANKALAEIAIENTTDSNSGGQSGAVKSGGKVIVLGSAGDVDSPVEPDMDGYKDSRLAVAWMPDEYWVLGDSFTILFKDFGDADWQTITFKDYLDANGDPVADLGCCIESETSGAWAKLGGLTPYLEIYTTASGNKAIKLAFGCIVADMPPHMLIKVDFAPTLAVQNVTPNSAHGAVEVEGGKADNEADGVPGIKSGTPYRALSVFGTPDSGYQVNMSNIAVRNMNLYGPGDPLTVLHINAGGAFSGMLETEINGRVVQVSVSGVVITRGGEVEVRFSGPLPVPLQVQLEFISIPPPNQGGSGGGAGANAPLTGQPKAGASLEDVAKRGENVPQTGDDTPIIPVAVLGLLSTCGAILLGRKKGKDKKR